MQGVFDLNRVALIARIWRPGVAVVNRAADGSLAVLERLGRLWPLPLSRGSFQNGAAGSLLPAECCGVASCGFIFPCCYSRPWWRATSAAMMLLFRIFAPAYWAPAC